MRNVPTAVTSSAWLAARASLGTWHGSTGPGHSEDIYYEAERGQTSKMKMTEVLGWGSLPSYPGREVSKSFFKASYGIKSQHRDGRGKGRSANNMIEERSEEDLTSNRKER